MTTTASLSRIALETMANYRAAATQVVAASGAGSRRVVRLLDGTLEQRVLPGTTRLAPRTGQRLEALRGRMSHLIERGIGQAEKAAETGIERGSDFALAQVTRLADLGAEVKNPLVSNGLETAARLSLPAAQLALTVSGKIAEGATALADVAGANPVGRVVRKAARGTKRGTAKVQVQAKSQAKSTVRRARAGAAEATRTAKTAAKTVAKRARRAA